MNIWKSRDSLDANDWDIQHTVFENTFWAGHETVEIGSTKLTGFAKLPVSVQARFRPHIPPFQ